MTNRLAQETSPYLQQHRENPVDWYPWGAEAFERARREQKPIFLSIGYSTCYWCHVMEQDSFEQQRVADLLNRDFIAVKVDREERPDVDQIYMDVVVGMNGSGGWPMSVFLTPELKPFWGGTFFYRAQFILLLEQVAQAWRVQRQKIEESATQITESVREKLAELPAASIDRGIFDTALRYFEQQCDREWGGFGGAPKFPAATALSFILSRAASSDRSMRSAM